MTNDHTPEVQVITAGDLVSGDFDDEFETAAKHHLAAATADDEGDNDATARHAFQAYRHQLNGVQYAEIAVMDNESLEEEFDEAGDGDAGNS